MRICVFGAGSLGSAVGGMLASHHEVVLVGRKANVSPIAEDGLRIRGVVSRTVKLDASDSVKDFAPPDLLIVATKAYSTSSVVDACSGWISGDTKVLTLQNGLGNLEKLRAWRGDRAIGGTTTMGASLVAPGIVRIAGIGKTIVGSELDPNAASKVSSAFRSAGIPAVTRREIHSEIWAKAIVNASINPLTAILRIPNGDLIESRTLSRLMAEICSECESVAEASAITLPVKSMYRRARSVARETAGNRSSMLRDIELGRRTEIDCINGHLCRSGEVAGVPTPLNNALVSMIKSLEAGTSEKA
ncbi:MAG: 2-dehydropantoate 2-reductase [Methanobacteriota archaeon]|nr:MAG: 2-dehydropantoate 2-reductase [Euryarchaeota archaeon]